jgi:hypothetical protein
MAQDGPTFLVAAGGWSGNIGNSFFNLGTQDALSKAVPGARVELISDQAAYWRMTPIGYRTEPRNSLRYVDHLRPDYVALQGSVLTEQFPRVWGRSLRILHSAGTRLLLMGVGFFDYSERERDACRELLDECPPYVFVSRDHRTYAALSDLAAHSHDGIDSAFFLPDVFRPIETDLPPYVVVNFDKGPEPGISVSRNGARGPCRKGARCIRFEFAESQWTLAFPRARDRLARTLGTVYPYLLGPVGLAATSQERAGEYLVVRTDHQINPIIVRKVFRGPNALAGDIPQSYINLYAQASLTLSDRVHAAVAALAYGRSAMLFTRSGRAAILDRVGASDVTTRPVRLDLDLLEREKEDELGFLRSVPF